MNIAEGSNPAAAILTKWNKKTTNINLESLVLEPVILALSDVKCFVTLEGDIFQPKYCISWKQGHPVKLNINPRTFHPFKKPQRWRFFAPKKHTICCKKSYFLSTWLANLVGISQARTRNAEWKGWEAALSKQPCKFFKLDRFPSTHVFKMNMIFVFSPIFGRFNLFEDHIFSTAL